MNTFDIDKYTPEYEVGIVLPKKMTKQYKLIAERTRRIFLGNGYHKIGVKPESILDWRALEKRRTELYDLWSVANHKLFDELKKAHKLAGLGKHDELHVYVERDWILTYTGKGICSTDPERLIKDKMTSESKDRYGVLEYENGGAEIGRLERRANRLLRSAGFYQMALERALRDRLNLYMSDLREKNEYVYYRENVFVIQNEGRVILMKSDHSGRLSIVDGEVFLCKAS